MEHSGLADPPTGAWPWGGGGLQHSTEHRWAVGLDLMDLKGTGEKAEKAAVLWGGGGRAGRDALEEGGGGDPWGAQPVPSHCPPDGNCQLQWHL